MRVIVFAEDLSGRRDDGYYTRPDISAALDIFYAHPDEVNFVDPDGQEPITRSDVEAIFKIEGKATFFNGAGEKVIITLDSAR
jgi:hypothetical protein